MRGDILNGLDVSRMASKLAKREQKPAEDHRFKVVLSSNDGKTCTIMVGDNQVEADTGVAVYPNDIVTARWRNGRYTVTSNLTKPSVNDSDYEEVKDIAQTANELLNGVAEVAEQADKTLDDIIADAVAASRLLDGVEDVATQADKTLAEIIEDAAEAGANASIAKDMAEQAASQANSAQSSAESANANAVNALNSLSTVEDVVGTLSWICEHGAFDATSDTSPQEGKRYFTRSGTSPNYSYAPVSSVPYSYALTSDSALDDSKTYYVLSNGVYTAVAEPDVSDIATYYERSEGNPYALGYYEFTGELDATVQNYISSHLSLTDEGLWVTKDGQGCHLLIANDRLSFVGTDGSEVAYIAVDPVTQESTFYMTRSVVVKDLKFGKWMWFERYNRNMALKWVG